MPLRIRELPEPLTDASRETPPILAECEAFRALLRDVLRYGRKQILGRSMLIAGHRGSGKTTLVRWAIQQAQEKLKLEPRAARPLLVALHGPDLLGGAKVLETAEEAEQTKAKAEAARTGSQRSKKARKAAGQADSESKAGSTRAALRMLTEALHRAYIAELGDRFEAAARGSGATSAPASASAAAGASAPASATAPPSATAPAGASAPGGASAAAGPSAPQSASVPAGATAPTGASGASASASTTAPAAPSDSSAGSASAGTGPATEAAPDPERLELAAQVRVALEHAPSLEWLRYAWDQCGMLDRGVLFEGGKRPGQGLKELVAAAEVIEGYKRVAGKLEDVDGASAQAKFSEQSQRTTGINGKDLLNGLTGLMAGGIAGAGVLAGAGTSRPVVAALAAVVTAVGSAAALNYSSTRQRESSYESKSTLTWDTSIASLDRMLPVMVERITDAGLAPIFVVDELDKVEGLDAKMDDLIRHLKHLVTEKAFFCFLADRAYYERTLAAAAAGVYGREHTFFSGRLFVHYLPDDFHAYLDKTLDRSAADDNERKDADVWPFLFLERARMHPIDLRRAVANFANEDWTINAAPGDVRSTDAFRAPILVQAIIETIVGEGRILGRLQMDCSFARLAYDALYYPVRAWESGEPDVDLSVEALQKELNKRIRGDQPSKGTDASTGADVKPGDLEVLHEGLLTMAEYLRDPQQLALTITERQKSTKPEFARYNTPRWNLIRDIAQVLAPRLGEVDENHRAKWKYDQFGNNLTGTRMRTKAAAAMPMDGDSAVIEGTLREAQAHAETIDRLDKALRELTEDRMSLDKLATEYGLLGLSPAWPSLLSASRAIYRGTAQEKVDAARVIGSYWRMLDMAAPFLGKVAVLASDLAPYGLSTSPIAERFSFAASMLAGYFRFVELDTLEAVKVLGEYDGNAAETLPPEFRQPPNGVQGLEEWLVGLAGVLTARAQEVYTPPPVSFEKQRAFYFRYLRGGNPIYNPSLDELRQWFASNMVLIGRDLEKMTYSQYAWMIRSLGQTNAQDANLLARAMEVELGFAAAVKRQLEADPAWKDAGSKVAELRTLCEQRLTAAPQGPRVLLVLGNWDTNGMANDWTVSRRLAVYPIYGWELEGPSQSATAHWFDPMVILATAGGATSRLEIFNVPVFRLVPAESSGSNYLEVPERPDIDSVMDEVNTRLSHPPREVPASPNAAQK